MASTSPQEFYTSFQAARKAIANSLDAISQAQQPSLDQIAQTAQLVQAERKRLNEATSLLPAYDRRSYDTQLQELEARIGTLRGRNAPTKGTFSFRKNAINVAPRPSPLAPTSKQESEPTQIESSRSISSEAISTSSPNLQISSSSYYYFTSSSLLQRATSSSTDLTITALHHCIVDLLDSPAYLLTAVENGKADTTNLKLTAVHIRDVKNSILLLGHVQGSILAHNLERCVVVAACHQLRVHTSHDTRFHLHVSNAIVEDCSSLTFTPYPETLPLPSEVRQKKSAHASVQDFSHLKSTPSPNWSSVSDPVKDNACNEIRALANSLPAISEEDRKARIEELLARILPPNA